MEEAIIAHLLASAGVISVVGPRVFPGKLPQGEAFPALIFNRIDGAPGITHGGPEGCTESRIQIDAYAPTYGAAKLASRAVREVLHGFKGTVDGVELQAVFLESEADGFEGEDPDPIHRVRMDITVWAVEA